LDFWIFSLDNQKTKRILVVDRNSEREKARGGIMSNAPLRTADERREPEIHIMWEGRNYDLVMNDLDIGDLSTDAQIRSAVATELEVPPAKLAALAIDKNEETGDITLRPQAEFGGSSSLVYVLAIAPTVILTLIAIVMAAT
jgi:hypothetical protein